jgi:Flp pilus assembly protein TadG
MKLLSRFTQDQSGVAALIFALAAPATLIGAGAAIAYGEVRMVRTAEQSALDAAVLSGAGLPASATDADRINAAQAMFNGQMSNFTPRLTQSVSATFSVQTITQDSVKVTGTANATFANPFGAFVGGRTLTVGTTAAAQTSVGPPICVYALNNRANGALDLNGNVNVSIACQVQVNSGSGSAVRAVGAARMSTTSFAVNGNYKGSAFTPPPKTGAAQLPDPFASLPFPAAGACTALSGTTIKANTTISQGTYCGGLRISSGAVVTMNPGIYIFTDGDFKVDSGAQVTGSEVMLAFDGKGAKFWMTGGAVMKITSPASGTYMNMQFMENRNNTAGNTWVSIGGNSQLQYDGNMYFPSSNIWVFGGSTVTGNSPSVVMLGDKLWFQDNSTITLTQSNPRNLPVKNLSQRVGAALIQ